MFNKYRLLFDMSRLWAAVKGALISTAVLFIFLVGSLFLIPKTPEEFGGHLYGVGTLMGVLIVCFTPPLLILYLILGLRKSRHFKLAIFSQSVLFIFLSLIVYILVLRYSRDLSALPVALYTFIFLSAGGVFGAWAWCENKKT